MIGLLLFAAGLSAQNLNNKITKATRTSYNDDGSQVVEKMSVSYVDIDKDSNVVVLSGKGFDPITIIFDQWNAIENNSLSKRYVLNYQGREVCDYRVSSATLQCEIKVNLDNAKIDLYGKCLNSDLF